MAEENTNVQENSADTQDSISVNAADTEQNTAPNAEPNVEQYAEPDVEPDTETSQSVEQDADPNAEQSPESASPEAADEPDEANTGTKVREYEAVALHSGVSRLGRLDQAYPDDEREREDLQGAPDGPINQPPYFPLDALDVSGDLEVKEKGVADGGNTPVDDKDGGIVTGTVTAIDPEGGPVQYFLRGSGGQAQELELTYGTITLDRLTGEFTYTLDNDDADTNGLNQGELVTETVLIYAVDEEGLESSTGLPVTISIEGTNDKPELILSEQSLAVMEGGVVASDAGDVTTPETLQDDGAAVGADVDDDAILHYAVAKNPDTLTDAFDATPNTVDGEYGTLTIDEVTGKYTYTLDSSKVNSFEEGKQVTENFIIYVRDEHGAWNEQPLTVTVTGGNDIPTITESSYVTLKDVGVVKGTNTNTEEGIGQADVKDWYDDGVTFDSTKHITDGEVSIGAKDVDNGAVLTYSFKDMAIPESGPQVIATDYGTITLDTATGEYSYTLNTAAGGVVDVMQEDDWHREMYVVEVTDEQDVTAVNTHEITIDIEGTNERPTLQLMDTSSSNILNLKGRYSSLTLLKEEGVEDVVEAAGDIDDGGNTPVKRVYETEGQLVGRDVDTGATLTYGIMKADGSHWYPENSTDSYSRQGTYGTMTLRADGTYTYELDDALRNLNKLPEGKEVRETLTFLVRDEKGAWSTNDFQVRIEGTNDSPVLTVGPALTVWENGGPFIDSGDASHTDVDTGASGRYSFGKEVDVNGNTVPILTLVTTYGTVRINPTSGVYEYTLDVLDADVQGLHKGDTLPDSFTVYVTDDKGATDSKLVNVTINGASDGPVFGGDSKIALLVEDGVTVSGNAANGVHTAVGEPSVSGKFEATDADDGDTAKLVYTVTADAGDEDTVTIDGVAYDIVTDEDAGTQTVTTAKGTFVLTMASGVYTYTLTQSAADSLLPGESLSESIGVIAAIPDDPEGLKAETSLLVTIEGTNDAPVIDVTASNVAVGLVEDVGSTISGTIKATDVDHDVNSGEVFYSFLKQGPVGSGGQTADTLVQTMRGEYGYIVMNQQTGDYSYELDASKIQYLAQGETVTETFPVRVVDALRAHADVPLVITITGADDAPTVTVPETTVFEDGGALANPSDMLPEITGSISVADVDIKDEQTFILLDDSDNPLGDGSTNQQLRGTYGTLTLNADGSYSYSLDDNAQDVVQTLNVGDTLSDSFGVNVTSGPVTQLTPINVTIAGSNDAPVLTISTLGEMDENDFSISDTVPFYAHTDSVPVNATTKAATGYTDMDKDASLRLGFLVVLDDKGDNDDTNDMYRAATEAEITSGDYEIIQTMRGDYGMLAISPDGTYTYTMDRHNPDVYGMVDGKSLFDKFMLSVIDEHGATDTKPVTVTIKGSGSSGSDTGDGTSTGDGDSESTVTDVTITNTPTVSVTEDGDVDTDLTTNISQQGDIILSKSGYDSALHLENNGTSIVGKYGTLVLGPNATYTFTLHKGVAAVDALHKGQVVTLDYPVFINGVEKGSIAVKIIGANDAPILDTQSYSHEIHEEATKLGLSSSVSGTVKAHDIDNAVDFETSGKTEALSYTFSQATIDALGGGAVNESVAGYQTVTTEHGSMTLNTSTGDYTYTISPKYAADKADLKAGINPQESFDIVVSDSTDSVTATVKIDIIADNTKPELSLEALQLTEDVADSDGHVMDFGKPIVTDLDTTTEPFTYAIADESGQNSAAMVQGTYGSLILDSTGKYSYVLNNASDAIQSLDEGETASDTFTYTVTDVHGGSTSQKLVVNITGANDKPELTVDTLSLVVKEPEVGSGSNTNTVEGQATVHDVDDGDINHVYTLRYEDDDGTVQTITGGSGVITTVYGTMTLTADGKYSYTVDGARDVTKALAQGEIATENVTLLVQDTYGQANDEFVEQPLTITIQGSNTAPELALSDGLVSDAVDNNGDLVTPFVTDGGTTYVFSGDAANETKDADSADADLRYSINTTDDPSTTPSASQTVQHMQGEYGTLNIEATGAYTYTVAQSLVEKLGAEDIGGIAGSQGLSETFTILVRDEYGALDQQQITMNITGTNDAPTLSVNTARAVVTDVTDGNTNTLVAQGVAAVDDVDTGDVHYFGLKYTDDTGGTDTVYETMHTVAKGSESAEVELQMPYGVLRINNNGAYSFTLDTEGPEYLDVQKLGDGESITDSFTILVKDNGGKEAELEIPLTINGVNDAPTFSSMPTEVDIDSTSKSTTGTLMATDVDDGDTLTFSLVEDDELGQDILPEYGTVAVDGNGDYTYTLHTGATLDDAAKDSFTIRVSDEHGGIDTETILVDLSSIVDDVNAQQALIQANLQAG